MKTIKELSDEELIGLFKKHNYCFENMARSEDFSVARETIRKEFIKRNIDYYKIIDDWKSKIVKDYNKSPKKCMHCGNQIPWEKRTNDYCSKSCSASENNKGVVRNPKGNLNNLVWKFKDRSNISNEKDVIKIRKENLSELIKADRHNDRLNSTYKNYKIPEIIPGGCYICGDLNCEREFCKKHNLQQLIGFVKHLGFNPTTIGTDKVFDEFNRVKSLIYNLYWNEGLSCSEIGERFGYPGNSTITKAFEHLEIPRRTLSESSSNALLNGKYSLPDVYSADSMMKNLHQEWHTTWTGEDVFLRSSYELDYAEYLDSNQISYSVENLRIEYFDSQQNKTRIAIPDFYISSTNEIIEIKSDFTLDIQEMLDKFKAYKDLGYIPKLILEGKEVNIYNIEEEVSEVRLYKIKNKNLSTLKNKTKSKDDIDTDKQI